MARPSEFGKEVADEICDRLAKGESLRTICQDEKSGWLPSETTVRRWLARGEMEPSSEYGEFRRQYAHAREMQAEHYADEIIAIADAPNVTKNPVTGEAELRDPQRDRLRVDARKWYASKLAPKRFGDKVEVEHSGSIATLPDDQLDARLAALIAKAGYRADEG